VKAQNQQNNVRKKHQVVPIGHQQHKYHPILGEGLKSIVDPTRHKEAVKASATAGEVEPWWELEDQLQELNVP
jgi:hypothetical protein